MHASHPIIPIWDDHESTNNPYMHGAENHQENEGDWANRRADSLQAYYEWMPIRDPQKGINRAELWRSFAFGELATLVTLETRHTGRSKQVDYSEHLPNIKNNKDLENFSRNILGAQAREMLSQKMQSFARQALKESKSKGQPWQILGNQIPMARTIVPQVPQGSTDKKADTTDPISAERAQFKRLGELGLPIYLDTWDGYPAARQRFYELCQQQGIEDLVVLTGDSHSDPYRQHRTVN